MIIICTNKIGSRKHSNQLRKYCILKLTERTKKPRLDMAHNESNHRFDGDEAGTFMKQESVMSLYEPTPMTPTQTTNKSISSATLLSPDSPNHAANGEMKRNASYGNLGNQPEARVLVLYTGGTIGMLRNDKNGEQSASN